MFAENSSRRDFLKLTGAGVAGAALSASASSYARILGANDRVGVGIVGFSDRCRSSLIPSFLKSAPALNSNSSPSPTSGIAAATKAPPTSTSSPASKFLSPQQRRALRKQKRRSRYNRHRRFQHSFHGVEAIHAGRDAYVEKPLAHTMEDAKAIRDAVKKKRSCLRRRHAASQLFHLPKGL